MLYKVRLIIYIYICAAGRGWFGAAPDVRVLKQCHLYMTKNAVIKTGKLWVINVMI